MSQSKLQPVRGTHDLLGEDQRRHRHVVETARGVAGRYGFDEIATPIFEFTDVFKRTLGDTSDVVTKEMYSFVDRGGEDITLRPEGTAGVVRALISGGLAQDLPLKFFYAGPMFRYERPQKGRFRQFHQIGPFFRLDGRTHGTRKPPGGRVSLVRAACAAAPLRREAANPSACPEGPLQGI